MHCWAINKKIAIHKNDCARLNLFFATYRKLRHLIIFAIRKNNAGSFDCQSVPLLIMCYVLCSLSLASSTTFCCWQFRIFLILLEVEYAWNFKGRMLRRSYMHRRHKLWQETSVSHWREFWWADPAQTVLSKVPQGQPASCPALGDRKVSSWSPHLSVRIIIFLLQSFWCNSIKL